MSEIDRRAQDCDDCGIATVVPTSPTQVLAKLPEALFSRVVPRYGFPEAIFDDVFFDRVVFGPIDAAEPTPQYEICRIIAEHIDILREAATLATADQLGLGTLTLTETGVAGEGIRARSTYLDRVGEQFGLGRPRGFTDCCYWRLVGLLRFSTATTRVLILDLCELYTGDRPRLVETPARISLIWPTAGGPAAYDAKNDPDDGEGWAYDYNLVYDGDAPIPGDPDAYDGAWAPTAYDPDERITYFSEQDLNRAPGLTLEDALDLAKGAGVFVELQNAPRAGRTGCYGALQRGPGTGFVWA